MTKSGWYCSTPNNLPSVKGHHTKLHVCTSDMVDANIGYVEMWTNIRISRQTLQNYNRISVWRYCSEISMWEDLHGLNPMYSLPQNTCVFTVSIHTSIYACFFRDDNKRSGIPGLPVPRSMGQSVPASTSLPGSTRSQHHPRTAK